MRTLSALLGGLLLAGSVKALVKVASLSTPAPLLAGPGAPTTNATEAQIRQTCVAIAHQIGSAKVRLAGALDVGYQGTVSHTWNAQQSYYRPVCIVYPANPEDITAAYQAIIKDDAPYGVRSGSHGVPYGYCATPGILIDMVNANKVEYDAERGVARIGPGNRWDRVYDTLAPYNVTVLGGRVSDVGMGLLLGGGVSYLAGEHGFGSTSFVEVDIVLPTGKRVVASPTNEYNDLLWGLQAGGNSFGVVTEFTLKVVPVKTDWWGGLIIYKGEQFQNLSDAASDIFVNVADPKVTIIPTFEWVGPPIGDLLPPFAIVAVAYNAPTPPPGLFDGLLAVPHVSSTMQTRPYAKKGGIVHLWDGLGAVYGNAQSFRTQTYKWNKEVGRQALRAATNLTSFLGNDLATFSLSFEHLPQSTIAISNQQGGIPYGFPEEALTFTLFNTAYKVELPVDRKQRLLQALIENSDSVLPSGINNYPLYVSYADATQRPLESYTNYQRLKSLKQKYDPTDFVSTHAGGPRYT
ncbi:hypothetical protein V8E36_002529 [Tilletia maclaganii]